MTAGVFISKKTLEEAAKKRDEDMAKLREIISDVSIREQCCEYFRIHINKIIAETEEEVRKFMATLRDASICIAITIGAVAAAVFTPPAILISPAAAVVGASSIAASARTIFSGIRVASLHKKQDENSEEEMELHIFDGCKVEVQLCFGKIFITLRSSIKLAN